MARWRHLQWSLTETKVRAYDMLVRRTHPFVEFCALRPRGNSYVVSENERDAIEMEILQDRLHRDARL